MKKLLRINKDGLFVEDVLIKDNENKPSDCIETPCEDGFYQPKWDGKKWVEGKTQAEVEVFVAEKALEDARVDNEITLRDRAKVAITNNKAYIALDPPTTVQALKQVSKLTIQMNALIRLVVNELDSVD